MRDKKGRFLKGHTLGFKKGMISWTKGKKGYRNNGSFKPGCKSLYGFKKGCIAWNKGKKWSNELRVKLSGSNANAWKGGITKERDLLKTKKEYILWRTAVFMRDDYTCQECNQHGGKLNADHIKPWSIFPELRYAIDNGRTLCINCHKQTDTYGGRILKYGRVD